MPSGPEPTVPVPAVVTPPVPPRARIPGPGGAA
ncbi:hypothetical protein OPKNFCMD_4862 [Methylobacterium crusticola]|uniref:Uncharacterized protein n=1 Tax=Methylobacterium crusticola TaxID=1697972 RepID=A0ABQ4R4P7_9HYPH|nr:hypothetical protein OPKNFCMD_4862 [Methylobacterium crusticola]